MQPVAAWHLVLRQSHQAGNARLGSQQVVEVGVEFAGGHVVPDVEHLALRLEQEAKIHLTEIGFRLGLDVSQARPTDPHPSPWRP